MPVVDGPGFVQTKGTYEYTAKVGGVPQSAATWAVDPVEAADVTITDGVAKVTPKTAVKFTLVATVNAQSSDPFEITAFEGPSDSASASIPLLGQGWGSVVVAVLIAFTVAALGFVHILGGEAIATFYGVLAGYVFSKASHEDQYQWWCSGYNGWRE